MNPLRLAVTVLGRTLLLVELGPPPPTTAAPPAEPQGQPEGETPGPITEHRAAPITQIGFRSKGERWADGREDW